MAKYKVKQGAYHEIYENKEITLPDEFELITGGEDDLGHAKHNGLFHWLGCTTSEYLESHKDEFDGFNVHTHFNYGPLVFVTIHDTQFYEEYPYLITPEEFNEKWQFSKYRVAEFSDNFRLKNMVQILFIESEFRIKGLEVTNRDYFDYHEFKRLEIHDDLELEGVLSKIKSTIHVSDNEIALAYWSKMISDVVDPFGATIPHKEVNINAAHGVVAKIPKDFEQFFSELCEGADEWTKAYEKAQRLMNFEEIEFLV